MAATFQFQPTWRCTAPGLCALASPAATRPAQNSSWGLPSIASYRCIWFSTWTASSTPIQHNLTPSHSKSIPFQLFYPFQLHPHPLQSILNPWVLIRSNFSPLLICHDLSLRFGDEEGISTLTFQHSIAYVHHARPKTFILEMVWKRSVRDSFLQVVRECCPHYAIWSGVINSAVVSVSQRTRFYIIGVDLMQAGPFRFDQIRREPLSPFAKHSTPLQYSPINKPPLR